MLPGEPAPRPRPASLFWVPLLARRSIQDGSYRLRASSTHGLSSENPPVAWLNTLYEWTSLPELELESTLLNRLNCELSAELSVLTPIASRPTGRDRRGKVSLRNL